MRKLLIGCTPDPDDAFAYHAIATGCIEPPPGYVFSMTYEPIDKLNRLAAAGELDVAAISSVHYFHVAREYAVLRSGASVGRGYGPRLVARELAPLSSLAGQRVGVPGETSTGATLLKLFVPGAIPVSLPLEALGAAVARGELAAGVLIHERLMDYEESRLVKLACLGDLWCRTTGLPLPVGLNVVRRSLGPELGARICSCVRDSMLHALAHRLDATAWALRFSHTPRIAVARQFIDMFANEDTVRFPPDCEAGLRRLGAMLRDAALVPADAVREVDYVEADRAPPRSLSPARPSPLRSSPSLRQGA
jgi:1,4-dihydroxy-6-naphthoate synthase